MNSKQVLLPLKDILVSNFFPWLVQYLVISLPIFPNGAIKLKKCLTWKKKYFELLLFCSLYYKKIQRINIISRLLYLQVIVSVNQRAPLY